MFLESVLRSLLPIVAASSSAGLCYYSFSEKDSWVSYADSGNKASQQQSENKPMFIFKGILIFFFSSNMQFGHVCTHISVYTYIRCLCNIYSTVITSSDMLIAVLILMLLLNIDYFFCL